MSVPDMDFSAYAEEVGIPIDAILVPSVQFAPWRLYNNFDPSSTRQTYSYDPSYVPPRAPSPEPYIHPLKPPPRRPRARKGPLQGATDTDAHSDLVPSAPPPSPTTPNRSEAGSKAFAPNILLDVTEFGVCRLRTQSPLAMEDSSSNLNEEHILCDNPELWTRSWPTEQKDRPQLAEERLSDDGMETSEENRDESDDNMEADSTASERPSGYVVETK